MAVIIKNRQVENNPWQLLRAGADKALPAVPPTGDIIVSLAQWQAQKAALLAQIPLGRLGAPEEIAAAVVFLASPGGAYITGTELHVNGGMFMA